MKRRRLLGLPFLVVAVLVLFQIGLAARNAWPQEKTKPAPLWRVVFFSPSMWAGALGYPPDMKVILFCQLRLAHAVAAEGVSREAVAAFAQSKCRELMAPPGNVPERSGRA